MKSLREHAEEAHFASMPHEFLHAETHQHLLDHGFELKDTFHNKHGNFISHHYQHPQGSGPADYGPDEIEDPPEHPAFAMASKLGQFGWRLDHLSSTSHSAGGETVHNDIFAHPNGSKLHIREFENEDDGTNSHHVIMRYPIGQPTSPRAI